MLTLMENPEGSSRNDPANAEQPVPERPACPKCGSADVRRSHTQGVAAAVLRVFGRWPFRCRSCRSRFYHATPPE